MVKKIYVGKKPGLEAPVTPVPKPVRKRGILSKTVEVIREDCARVSLNIRALISPTPPGWEEYRRFLELSRRGGGK